jgi:PadR family transcriptional regulator, regulatory protein PadR
MKADAVRGHLDMLLLAVVQSGPAHGYAIVEELRRRSDEALDLPEGTVYPALHRLERQGLLASEWHTVAGRRRRVYRTTPRGLEALAVKRREWVGFTRTVRAVLGGGPWPEPT